MRHNRIRHVQIQGSLVANHAAKVEALTAHFRELLGVPGQSTWNFDVAALYQDSTQPSSALVHPFREEETKQAIAEMNRNSAPGPDGFGPSFYKAAWSSIKPQVLDLLLQFQAGEVDLDRINRSYMVLIPKKAGAVAVDAFRPICLQNCSVKLIAKILTIRLQREISGLVDSHQTGFLQGRSIAESFVHAVELIQHCQKRKKPSIAIKLDFAKAFDTVNWDGLLRILQARGFHQTWINWILHLLQSSRSAILVNGCPGPWISVKRGLRQGDPLSPFLFLIVADVLQ
jgi:hypothetical protein